MIDVQRWLGTSPPTEQELRQTMQDEGLSPYTWSNGPGDRYSAHSHSYHKVLYCLRGSIRFVDESAGRPIDLEPGDRLDIPPATPHSALVGPEGVTCLEAQKK